MKIPSFLLAFVLLFAAFGPAQIIVVPRGHDAMMIDGKLGDAEWDDAAQHEVPGRARMYVKQSEDYIWFAVEFTHDKNGTMDLYLSPADGKLYNLHVSAKLGERAFGESGWPEWDWWNNRAWTGNVGRFDSFEPRRFLPDTVRELQIERSRFPGKEWKVMLDLMTQAAPEWKTTSYPAEAKNTDTKGWMRLVFDPAKDSD